MRVVLTSHVDPKGEIGWMVAEPGEPVHVTLERAEHEAPLPDPEFAVRIVRFRRRATPIRIDLGGDEKQTPYFELPRGRFVPYRILVEARSRSARVARAYGAITVVPVVSHFVASVLALLGVAATTLLVWVYLHLPPTHWADVFEWIKPTGLGALALAGYVALRRDRSLPLLGLAHDPRISGAFLAAAVLLTWVGPTSFVARVHNATKGQLNLRLSNLGPTLEISPGSSELVWVGRDGAPALFEMLGGRRGDYCANGTAGDPAKPGRCSAVESKSDWMERLLRIEVRAITCRETTMPVASQDVIQPRNDDCSLKDQGNLVEASIARLKPAMKKHAKCGTCHENGAFFDGAALKLESDTTEEDLAKLDHLAVLGGRPDAELALRLTSDGKVREVTAVGFENGTLVPSPVTSESPLSIEVFTKTVDPKARLGSLQCSGSSPTSARAGFELLPLTGARLASLRIADRNTTFSEWQSNAPERRGVAAACLREWPEKANDATRAELSAEVSLSEGWYPSRRWSLRFGAIVPRDVDVYLHDGRLLGTARCEGEQVTLRPVQVVGLPKRAQVKRLSRVKGRAEERVWERAQEGSAEYGDWVFYCEAGALGGKESDNLKKAEFMATLADGGQSRATVDVNGELKYWPARGAACYLRSNVDPPKRDPAGSAEKCTETPHATWLAERRPELVALACEPSLVRICP